MGYSRLFTRGTMFIGCGVTEYSILLEHQLLSTGSVVGRSALNLGAALRLPGDNACSVLADPDLL